MFENNIIPVHRNDNNFKDGNTKRQFLISKLENDSIHTKNDIDSLRMLISKKTVTGSQVEVVCKKKAALEKEYKELTKQIAFMKVADYNTVRRLFTQALH